MADWRGAKYAIRINTEITLRRILTITSSVIAVFIWQSASDISEKSMGFRCLTTTECLGNKGEAVPFAVRRKPVLLMWITAIKREWCAGCSVRAATGLLDTPGMTWLRLKRQRLIFYRPASSRTIH